MSVREVLIRSSFRLETGVVFVISPFNIFSAKACCSSSLNRVLKSLILLSARGASLSATFTLARENLSTKTEEMIPCFCIISAKFGLLAIEEDFVLLHVLLVLGVQDLEMRRGFVILAEAK